MEERRFWALSAGLEFRVCLIKVGFIHFFALLALEGYQACFSVNNMVVTSVRFGLSSVKVA